MGIKSKGGVRQAQGGSAPALFRMGLDTGGVSSLPQSLLINSQSVPPTYLYEARDATTSDWAQTAGTGGTFSALGSGGTADRDAPTPGAMDRAFDCAGTRAWESPSNDSWAGEDAVVECIFQAGSGTGGIVTTSDGTTRFWVVEYTGGVVQLRINDGTTTATISSAASSIVEGAWYHALFVVDRSGSGQCYLNGQASGSAVSVSSVGDIDAAKDVVIGRQEIGGTNPHGRSILQFGLWLQDAWLDTHLQATFALERFARVCGVYNSGVPIKSDSRLSLGVVERVSHEDSAVRYHVVGNSWWRVDRVEDLSADTRNGYCAEEIRTQLVPDNTTLTNLGTITNCSLATDGTLDPFYTQAWGLTSTGVGDISHLAGHTEGVTGQRAGFVFVKEGARDIVFIERVSGSGYYFDLGTGTVGTQVGTITPRTQDLGDGWFKLGFDIDTAGDSIIAYAIQTDGDLTYDATADSGAVALYIAYPNLETGTTTGEAATSPLPTTGSSASRLADQLTHNATGIDLSVATLVCEVLHPDAVPENNGRPIEVSDLTGANRHTFTFNGTVGEARIICREGGASTATLTGTTVLVDGNWHEWRVTWQQDDFELFVDLASEATDNLGNIPAAFTELSVGVSLADTKQPNARLRPTLYNYINDGS